MILCSGAFDGLHGGHVAYLEAAKALCEGNELLVCAIAPDDYIVHAKGRAPYWTQADRLRTVRALGCVDAAIAQAADSVATLIRDYRPRLFVKGPDWQGRLPEDVQQACAEVGTSIWYLDTPGVHVSATRPTDEEALEQFEALVLNQKPAATPWQPVTDYSFEARKEAEGIHPDLICQWLIPHDATNVLDYGCGPDWVLVRLLRELGGRASIVGYDPQIPQELSPDPQTTLCRFEPTLPQAYSLVICREVLEHCTIRQIRQIVTKLCDLSSRFVYVTTRFAQHPTRHLLTVETADGLDPTHITMLTQCFLRTLFVLEGFKRRLDLEEKLDWQKQGRCLVYERT